MAKRSATAGWPRWNAVSKQATCGRPGYRAASVFSTASAGGLCSGASGDTASIRASEAASTSTGAVSAGPPCTTRWPKPPGPARSTARRAVRPAPPGPRRDPRGQRRHHASRRQSAGAMRRRPAPPIPSTSPASARCGAARRRARRGRARISGSTSRRSAHTGCVIVIPLGLSLSERACSGPIIQVHRREPAMTKFGVAQPVRRVEDPRLLKGSGRYTDDIVLPGMLHGVVVRSPHAAARITAVDTAAAKAIARRAGRLHRRGPACRRHRPAALRRAGAEPRRHADGRTRRTRCWRTRRCAMSAIRWPSSSPKRSRPRATRPSWSRWTTICCPRSPICRWRPSRARRWSGPR